MPITITGQGTLQNGGTAYFVSGGRTVSLSSIQVSFNGSNAVEVWKKQTPVYPDGNTVQTAKNGTNASAGAFYAETQMYQGSQETVWAKAYVAFDASAGNTLTVTYSWQSNTYSQGYIGVCSAVNNSGANYLPSNQRANYGEKDILYKEGEAGSGSNITVNVDISNLSGTHYLVISEYTGAPNNYARASISNAFIV